MEPVLGSLYSQQIPYRTGMYQDIRQVTADDSGKQFNLIFKKSDVKSELRHTVLYHVLSPLSKA